MTENLRKKISELLKKYYPPNSPDLKALRLNRHAKGIAEATQDPLLWIRLIYGSEILQQFGTLAQTVEKRQLKDTEDAVQERMTVLEKFCMASQDKPDLASLGGKYGKLFEYALHHEDSLVIPKLSIEVDGECSGKQVDKEHALQGIVVDIYLTPSKQWVGYVCLPHNRDAHLASVFKFNCMALAKPWYTQHTIHVGDAVEFSVDSAYENNKIQDSTMRVVEYPPGIALDETFIQHYFSQIKQASAESSLPTLLLQSPAPWKSFLNEKAIYSKYYKQILAVYFSLSRTDATELPIPPELMSIIGRSAFVVDVPNVLKQDPRQNHDKANLEYKSFQRDVHAATHLLLAFAKYSPDEAYTVADALKGVVRLSQEEIQSIALSIIETYFIPDLSASQIPESEPGVAIEGNPILDPLFWVRLFYCNSESIKKSSHLTAVSASNRMMEKVVVKRQEVLKNSLKLECIEHLNMAEFEKQTVLTQIEQVKAACLLEIELKKRRETDENSNPALLGVIVDVYPTLEGNIEGYVACPVGDQYRQTSTQSSCCVYKFDRSTPILTPNEGCLLPLHIGDTIAFKPVMASENQVCTVLEVAEYYPPALSEDFATHYFRYINPTEGMEALLRVLESPAPWRGILNKPALYQKHYGSILTVYNACISTDTATDATKKLVHTFRGCSFIQNIPQVLDQDVDKTEQYVRNVRIAANLLSSCVQHLGSEAKTVLKYMVEKLPMMALYPEFQSLTLSLIDSCLAPPASLTLSERPWKTIPTLLTKDEFEVSVQSPVTENPELPKVKDIGCYKSIDEYGRTYFTLLRADCYGELIDTIARLKTQCRDECQDIFYDIAFIGLSQGFQNRSIVYAFRFEAHIPSEKSQDSILTQGNLMCFSIGGKFEGDLVWGTVDRIAEVCSPGAIDESGKEILLKEGKLYVQLWSEANDYPDEEVMVLLKQSKDIVAVESPAYFRAYYPVLEALKNLELEKVYFRDDLLDPGHEVKSKPEILSDSTKVDPRPVYKSSCVPGQMTVGQLKEALLDKEEDNSPLCLDLSQRDAIYNALSYPLTVVQGPPGTGKTLIAVKLLHLFLSLNTLPSDKPILVMAYKNRALDHFIHGCISPTPSGSAVCTLQDIVRIGRKSEDYDDLQEALLNKKVKNAMCRTSWIEYLRKLQLHNERIQKASRNLDKRSKLTLQNCLCSITPEWLKSLLLEVPPQHMGKLKIPQEVKSKLQCDPKGTMDLLKEEGITGRQHSLEKKAVKTALYEAWKVWTADLSLQLEFQSSAKHTRRESSRQPSSEQGDSVEDFAQLQQERLMAADDFDHQEDRLKDSLETNIIDLAINEDMKIEDYHTHVWDLSPKQRKQLILSAVVGGYSSALDSMQEALRNYNKVLESYEWKKQAESLRILRRAKVVAMTTTGAAIHQQLLNKLEAPVLFVEEAAEVLESNLLACLTPHVKHLVLIGDHKQLKPKVACSKLGKYHRFNISMFERLVNNKFRYTILMRQNRMHPNLVRLFSYHYALQKKEAGQLQSAKKTREYYHPQCMAQQFFWWSYTEHLEEKRGGAITNLYEVKMVIALCIWLLSQTTDCKITILTPYQAQLKLLQEGLKEKAHTLTVQKLPDYASTVLANIPVRTVDEFQGHESDVIILSLVRSNKRNLLGFLREKNRLVVGTSRQKHALYIVGNAKFLEASSPVLWKNFIQRLHKEDIGDAVPVIQHEETHKCTTPGDLETRAFLQTERQESTLDMTECDSPVKSVCTHPVLHQPQRINSESNVPTGRPELVTAIGDEAIPVRIHCQETHGGTEATACLFETQRQESASNEPVRGCAPPDTRRAGSLDLREELQTSTAAMTNRQQSSPAALSPTKETRDEKFRNCCLALQKTDAINEWKDIGRHLSVSDTIIDSLSREEKSTKEQFYQMMQKWWKVKGIDAVPEKLKEALKDVNLRNVLDSVTIDW